MTRETVRVRRRPHTLMLDLVAAALVLPVGLLPRPGVQPDQPAGLPIRAVTLVLLVLLLPQRRRHPLVALIVAAAALLASPLWTGNPSGYLLVLAITVYRVATAVRPRFALAVCGGTAAVLVVGMAAFGELGPYDARLFEPVAFMGAGFGIGQAIRNQRATVAAIVERAERAERGRALEARRQVTEERLRIARELHDAAAHQIAAINLHAGVASNALPEHPADAERSLEVIREAARSVLDEISALLRVLREERPADSAEVVASMEGLDALVDEFGKSGLQVDLELVGDAAALDGAAGVVAYRSVQEGLANALKHGDGSAAVRIEVGDEAAHIRVTNPVPAHPGDALPAGGHGLLGVRERVDSVRGRMRSGREAQGYLLEVDLPLPTAARR